MPAGRTVLVGVAAVVCAVAAGCKTTVDSLGSRGDAGTPPLRPITGPASYPNPFKDLLGKTDAEIAAKINGAFMQLFHGDSGNEAIYFTSGTDAAYIRDVLHTDIRTEGIGVGLMVAVQLNARAEFDRLWRYARTNLLLTTGANAGYYQSKCDVSSGTATCIDPYGYQLFTMALIFAHDRWVRGAGADAGTDGATDAGAPGDAGDAASGDAGTEPAALDYQADAQALLRVMQHKEDDAGGIIDGVTNTFDAATKLIFDVPNQSAGMVTRPSIEMPAFYALWGQATGDAFWGQTAAAARGHWKKAANATTGLVPLRANFDGTAVSGWDTFGPEAYRTHVNMVLDRIWGNSDAWLVDESNRLLTFFASKGVKDYGRIFSLDGTDTMDTAHDGSLVVMNGAVATNATVATAKDFVAEVWNMATPTGPARYYTGILDLMALLVLGGQYRVW